VVEREHQPRQLGLGPPELDQRRAPTLIALGRVGEPPPTSPSASASELTAVGHDRLNDLVLGLESGCRKSQRDVAAAR